MFVHTILGKACNYLWFPHSFLKHWVKAELVFLNGSKMIMDIVLLSRWGNSKPFHFIVFMKQFPFNYKMREIVLGG